jgi:tetratricopeptide (TPR) repeat protein
MQSNERDISRVSIPIHNTFQSGSNPIGLSEKAPSQNRVQFLSEFELVKNADVLVKSGDFHLARNLIARGLQFYPKSNRLLRTMSDVAEVLEDFDLAIKCQQYLLKIQRDSDFLLKCGQLLQKQGRFQEARELYFDFLAHNSVQEEKLFFVYKEVGNICVRDGDLEAAEEFYNKAFAINPLADALLVNYGTLELQRENSEQALMRFREALAVNKQNPNAWVGLALAHRTYGDLDLSRANLVCALDYDPYNKLALRLFAEWSVDSVDLRSVIERVDTYVEKHDQDFEFIFLLAKLNFIMGRFDKARFDVEKACMLNLDSQEALKLYQIITHQAALESR